MVIPPDSAMNVPVRLPFHDLRVQKSDWLVETKQIRPGLLAARTLLPHNSGYAAIVLLNMSGINQSLKSGLELGRAVACPPQVIRELESDEFDYAKSAASNNGVAISVGEADEVSDLLNGGEIAGEETCAFQSAADVAGDVKVLNFTGNTVDVELTSSSSGGECRCVDAGVSASNSGRHAVRRGQSVDSADVAGVASESDVWGVASCQTCPVSQVSELASQRASADVIMWQADAARASAITGAQRTPSHEAESRVIDAATELSASEDAATVNAASVAHGSKSFEFIDTGVSDNGVSCVLDEYNNSELNSDLVENSETFIKTQANIFHVSAEYPAHVQPVIDRLPDSLTVEQRQKAIGLITRNADVFSRHEFDVGCTNLLTASIETGNHPPISEPLRRHARAHLDVIDETIDSMEAAGIVEKASSPWSFNLVVVGRYDDDGKPTTPRITIDYRKLNAITYKDRHPLPHIKDCLQSLDNVSWLSSVDISNAYYQIPLREQDKDKTAFITRKGQYRLNRLGQGQTNSPAIFARLMGLVLRGLSCCLAFLDDTLCFSSTFEQHLADLQAMFDRFRAAQLKLKPKKCKLFQGDCDFLGHHISSSGLSVQERKVACIKSWPFPKNITELRAFIGTCSYYRAYCKNFAAIAEPLTECLGRGVPLEQTPRRQEAFDKLKEMLTTAPVLAVPRDDPNCTYVIDTDASKFAASSVCQQWQDGKLRVIEYASRVFNKAERNYCATRREMAAVIFALRQFRPLLLGRRFQIRVDNQALSFFQRLKDPVGQAARYLEFLADYDYEIIFRPGSQNGNADGVSRIPPCSVKDGEPCDQCVKRVIGKHSINVVTTRARSKAAAAEIASETPGVISDPTRSDAISEANKSSGLASNNESTRKRRRINRRGPSLQVIAPQAWEMPALGWTNNSLRQAQLADPNIGPALAWVELNQRPTWLEVESKSPMLRALWTQFDSLRVFDGILYRSFYDSNGLVVHHQLVLPHELRVPFLELIHNDIAGHLKLAKCIPHIMRRAWWHGWRGDLNLFIKCCSKCESFHRGKLPQQARLKPTYAGWPGEKIAIDLQGPFPASNAFKYILTALCLFSKYGVCVPLRNK